MCTQTTKHRTRSLIENKRKIAGSHLPVYESIDSVKIEQLIQDLFLLLDLDITKAIELDQGGDGSNNQTAGAEAQGNSPTDHGSKAHELLKKCS